MRYDSGLGLLLFLATTSAQTTIQPCLCLALPPVGIQVNCSSLKLMSVPPLPPDTTVLHLQDNQLTAVSPGLFDRLPDLTSVCLARNPFHCDCRIQYLRNWLLKNKAIISEEPVCVSPRSVAHMPITELRDDYFHSCAKHSCASFNILLGVLLCSLIALLTWGLRLAKTSTYTLAIDERHTGFKADSLRSQKPKHKKRRRKSLLDFTWTEEEGPLINMELLPQILDVLHKKHSIKIKAT